MNDAAEALLPVPVATAEPTSRPRNLGGRPKGSPNKLPRELRARLKEILESKASDVERWLDSAAAADPAEGVRLYCGLAQFILPRLSAAAVVDVTPPPTPIRERLTRAGISQEQLLSPQVAALIQSGQAQTLDEVIAHISEQSGAVTIDGELEAAELDPLVR